MRRLTRMLRRRMRPRGCEGRYQHAIVRRGGHRRRREGTDGAAAGDGAWFRHCCCRFRAAKNGPLVAHCRGGPKVKSKGPAAAGRHVRTSPVALRAQLRSQSRNNGKRNSSHGLPHTSCGRAYPLRRCFAIGIPPLPLTATTYSFLPPSLSLPLPPTIIISKKEC